MPPASQTPPTPRLQMRAVRKRFGATQALSGVTLTVAPGEVMALVGENGAGKSTLMKVLSGAHLADDGEMFLDGQPYRPRHPLDARRAGVAMIYQELSLAPHLSVMENILLGVESTRGGLIDWSAMRRRASAAMREVGLATLDAATPVHRLAIAQQQLVEIARAVALECRVLVLDEPTSSLTRHDIATLFDLIRRLRRQGIAVIYISHFLEEVQQIADRFTVLRDGESVGTGVTAETSSAQIIALMVGRTVNDLYPHTARTPGPLLLDLQDLAGRDKPVQASLQLHRGEVLGVAGLIGAGRTEMLRALFGLDPVRRGTIRVGLVQGVASPAQRWTQRVGMLSEDRKREGLALNLSIADNITLASLSGLGPGRLVRPSRQQRACLPWIEKIPIKCAGPTQRLGDLSGGNQQKVALARLLHADVDLLLLDEPTRGIDVGSKAHIYRLIDELTRQGKAVLIVSSYLPELLGVCDRIAVMCRGRLSTALARQDCTEHRLMELATGQETA
ncbi:MAG: sugar ABC transporter ATP-binding protein [Lentisphaerae bacterium]|nr:sugar ABC transporter ATP-binding protein [Lentisphaerota bacterium]